MSHEVEIDPDRLDAEMAAFEVAPETGAPGQDVMLASDAPQESEWLATMVFAFSALNTMAPNWQVPDEKIHELAAHGAAVMDQWFPWGPGNPDRLPPWAQFLVCLGGIVVMHGWDWQQMSLKPLTEQPPEPDPIDGEAAGESSKQAPVTPGKFTTMGSVDDE